MDLGMVGVGADGSVGFSDTYCLPASSTTTTISLASDLETKSQKWYGSGFLKQERSSSGGAYAAEDEEWKNLIKVAKADDFSSSRAMQQLQHQKRSDLVPDGQQMLSFSSPNTQAYYHHTSSANTRNYAGYGSGGLNAASMNGVLAGVLRGPFTPSQWMELEHQALIYKYITANVPIPSNLLLPIKKALESAGFPCFSGPLGHSSLGWGAFRLGFSNSTDPEPGRCRRTDGKKWRCSRDAVQDHKYCERHMNRGRHRSRKPVEGQNGSGTTTAATTKHVPVSTSPPSMVVPGGGTSNTIGFTNHHPQLKSLQSGASNACTTSPHIDRMFLNKENAGERLQDATDLSMLPPAIGLKDSQFSIPKQQSSIYHESARSEFGRVCSDSLLNPLHKSSNLISCRNYGSTSQDQEDEPQYSVRQFMDDWPKNQSDRGSISWPHMDHLQADRTQLSISILPTVAATDSDKLAASPLRLSRELEMGLGVGSVVSEQNERQASWMPLPCESPMGGPLGEVLHSSSNNNSNVGDYKNSSALNLMTGARGGWDSSPPLGSSPTGVLQKVTFRSLSNSSAGSSPRAENHRIDHHHP